MSLSNFLLALCLGALSGWLSGVLSKGSGFGLVGNVVVGVIGAILAHFLFGLVGIRATSLLGQALFMVAGAVLLGYLLRTLKR